MQEIEIAELRRLTRIVKDRFKYDFSNYAMSSFKRRISRVLELYKFRTVDNLIMRLETDPGFFEEFISEITVNVTEMFRDASFWKVLKEQIIPNILYNHNKINIWHAGCSSGEEAYSMAILLKELGAESQSKIIASDIDTSILQRAKKGVVPLKNMVVNGKNYTKYAGEEGLSKYYTERNGEAILDRSIVDMVSFRRHDLVQGKPFSKFDLVLCRNVMIYFNQTLQNDVLNSLHGSLFKYGYLAIGAKESLIWCDISSKFIVVNNEEKIYKKIKD